jgi:hypothetical protein
MMLLEPYTIENKAINRKKIHSAWAGLLNNKDKTELPHYAINKSLPEDTFFTNRDVARKCFASFCTAIKNTNINMDNWTFIEPSAGEGCFYDCLPNHYKKIGLDIIPRADKIQQADFLTWYPATDAKFVVIGNPPFGVRGAMALAFIKRAFLFADVVAFILPMSFYSNGKGSNMKRVEGATLIHNEPLPNKAFYLPDSHKPVSVKTVFQVWVKGGRNNVFTDYDVSEYVNIYTCCSSPARYCGLGRGRKYNCFIASTFYKDNIKTVDTFDEVNYGSGYGMIIKKNKKQIMNLLKSANWIDYCSDATNNCKHIRMFHIRKLLGENGFGVKKI